MKINGYELNVSEDFLDDIFAHKTRTIELVNKDFPGYRNLTEAIRRRLSIWLLLPKFSTTWPWNRITK